MTLLRIRSSIPARARGHVVERHPTGAPARVEYFVGRSIVGCRLFDPEGGLEIDYGTRRGKAHGRQYWFHGPGKLQSVTSYRNGLEHGLARQWSDDGRLIGTYRMRNGTGVDLWWQETWTKPRRPYLAEVYFMMRGKRHGFEWWLDDDQRSVHTERHWSHGHLHGIEREWYVDGGLFPGFQRFYVDGKRVSRRVYERRCNRDPSLPRYRTEDNRPQRTFPPIVTRRLTR